MISPRFRKLVLPAIVVLSAFTVLLGLGLWQLQRKAWKEGIITAIAERAYGAPASLPLPATWGGWRARDAEYTRVSLKGVYEHNKAVLVRGLMPGEGAGQPVSGYYVLTPVVLADGAHVIVNRGFVPAPPANPVAMPAPGMVSSPAGEVAISGLMRGPEVRNSFTPDNNSAKNDWYVRDPAAIASARGLANVAPFIVDADAASEPGTASSPWPKGGLTRLVIPNDHLQYALTWFGIAGALLVIFAIWASARLRGDASGKIYQDVKIDQDGKDDESARADA
jgi:surfeit locus 1 family protein